MIYKLVHLTCGGVAGFSESIALPLADPRAGFHYTGGGKANFTNSKRYRRALCETCKHAIDGSDVQPRRLEAPEVKR